MKTIETIIIFLMLLAIPFIFYWAMVEPIK